MKATFWLKASLVILLLLTVTACAPRPVFRLKPVDTNTTWYHGSEYVQLRDAGLTLTLAYYRHRLNDFIIDLEVDNRAQDTLQVDPAAFYYRAYEERPTEGDACRVRMALDPEKKLLAIDKRVSRAEADHRTYRLIDATVEVASLAAEVASKPNRDEQEEWDEARADRAVNRQNERADYHNKRAFWADRRQAWETQTLRKTDLFPGDYIRGDVHFPIAPNARYLDLRFPVGKRTFSFLFRQIKIKASR